MKDIITASGHLLVLRGVASYATCRLMGNVLCYAVLIILHLPPHFSLFYLFYNFECCCERVWILQRDIISTIVCIFETIRNSLQLFFDNKTLKMLYLLFLSHFRFAYFDSNVQVWFSIFVPFKQSFLNTLLVQHSHT